MDLRKTLLLPGLFLACFLCRAQNEIWLREIDIPGNVAPIYGLTISPDGKNALLAPSGGRLIMMNISTKGVNAETGKSNESIWWKRLDLSGFHYGSKPVFSKKGKYILVQECNSMAATKVRKIDYYVLDANTGKDVLKGNNVYSVSFMPDEKTVVVSQEDMIQFIEIESGKVTQQKAIENVEVAAVSNNGKIIALSFDPTRKEFKEVESIGKNKKELRNANKNKKLIAFYDTETLDKLYTINDEMDIIYRMVFTADDKDLVVYSKNKVAEHINQNADIIQSFASYKQTRQQYNLQKIDASTGIIDRDFFYSTEDWNADFKINKNKTLFGFTQTPGFFAWKRKLSIFNYNEINDLKYAYLCQGQLGSNNIHPINFDFADNDSIAYVAQGLQMIEWNYKRMPDYAVNPEGTSPNTLSEAARAQMDSLMKEDSDLVKSIRKLGIKGFYIFDITLQKKGEVLTIYAQSDEKTDIPTQNQLKTLITKSKFDLDIPKNIRVKFKYSFDIPDSF